MLTGQHLTVPGERRPPVKYSGMPRQDILPHDAAFTHLRGAFVPFESAEGLSLLYRSAADDRVAVIQNHGLAFGYRALGLVELDP